MDIQSILSAATGGHGLAVNPWASVAYLVAGVLFILALSGRRAAAPFVEFRNAGHRLRDPSRIRPVLRREKLDVAGELGAMRARLQKGDFETERLDLHR